MDFLYPVRIQPILQFIKILTMPKITIAKNCNFTFRKNNIRLTRKLNIEAITSDTFIPKCLSKHELDLGILPLYRGHDLATLLWSEYVNHY